MPIEDTASIGNRGAGKSKSFISETAYPTLFGAYCDGDKIRGIRLEMSDGSFSEAGEYKPGGNRYTTVIYPFQKGETLKTAFLRDSGYGYGSVRQIEFTTSIPGKRFYCGPGGFDHEASLNVEGKFMAGFDAWVNNDNFISALSFKVNTKPPPPPPKPVPYFETAAIGNKAAAHNQVQFASETSTAHSFAVRWDGDKVRGVSLTLKDNTTMSTDGFGDANYPLTSFTFMDGETLQSLNLSSSGYGHQSLRQLSFTTSLGRSFEAGPGGVDDLLQPPVAGSQICGFHAWVNADRFVNAFAFCCTDNAPFFVNFNNFSPSHCAYQNGVVLVNGKPTISIKEQTHITAEKQRILKISPSMNDGLCMFNGAAALKLSIFGDGTWEAHFGKDGKGSAAGFIPALWVKDELVRNEALVRKYAPIQMLNDDEVYWQTNVDDFLSHMIVETVDNGQPQPFDEKPLNRYALAEAAAALGKRNTNSTACLRTRAELNEPSDTQDWMTGTRPGPNNVKCYAVVSKASSEDGDYLDITYWWLFNYNQGKTVASTSYGNHVADWEHLRISLSGVDLNSPGTEKIYKVMMAAHDDTPVFEPKDCEFYGSQVLAHFANGDHEIYPHAGTYDRPMGTHDYCKTNPCEFDQRLGYNIEIYRWDEAAQDFMNPPQGNYPAYKDPSWIRYRGRWGNWQRGDLMGLVARLESGPEGLFRPGEYSTPQPLT